MTEVDEPNLWSARSTCAACFETSPGHGGRWPQGLLTGAFYGMSAVFRRPLVSPMPDLASFMATAILGGAAAVAHGPLLRNNHDRRVVALGVRSGCARERH